MKKELLITRCIRSCPFYRTQMNEMYCGHPFFKDKEPYESYIITQGEGIPSKCPLRKESLVLKYRVK